MSKLAPFFDRVLLRREKLTKVGSILMPESAKKRMASLKCEIVAVGETVEPSIRVGMTVLIGKYAGDWLNATGDVVAPESDEAEFYICSEKDLLCEVTDD